MVERRHFQTGNRASLQRHDLCEAADTGATNGVGTDGDCSVNIREGARQEFKEEIGEQGSGRPLMVRANRHY